MNQLIKALFFVFAVSISGCQLDEWQKPIDPVINPPQTPCNGSPFNCGMRLNEVIFPTTLKSYCYEVGVVNYVGPSQKFPINHQLRDGIRAIMLDVFYEGGQMLVINKGLPLNLGGSEPLSGILAEVKSFMAEYPNEVIVMMLNTSVNSSDLQPEFDGAGLLDSLHKQEFGAPWPTLNSMIESGKRLVVFSNSPDAGAGFTWNHSSVEYIVSTSLPASRADWNCAPPFQNHENVFYLLQHRVGIPLLNTSNADSAKAVNAFDILEPRIWDCRSQAEGKVPNFIAVDFYTQGDLFSVCTSFLPVE